MMSEIMLDTSTGKPIRAELVEGYFHSLINKFFKILPLYEDNETTLCEYMRNLQAELLGFQSLLIDLRYDVHLVSLLSILEYLIDMHSCFGFEMEKAIIKREVFGAIRVCEKMEKRYHEIAIAHPSVTESDLEV